MFVKKTATMKKLMIAMAMIMALIPMESFSPAETSPNDANKIGVWKTYQDFVDGKLTDLGQVTENSNQWNDGGIFFDKEHVMPETTKYWGARIPQFELKKGSFVHHDLPQPNTSIPCRFFEGKKYYMIFNPMPIGVYSKFVPTKYTGVNMEYDANGNVTGGKQYSDDYIMVGNGDGPLQQFKGKESARFVFDDDPEIQKEYDNDEQFKGHVLTGVKAMMVFQKYAIKYNKKHTPGYKHEIKEWRKVKD